MRENLVAGSSGLGDHTLELINLRLGTSESTELLQLSETHRGREQIAHTLFFASLRARLSLLLRRSSITRRS